MRTLELDFFVHLYLRCRDRTQVVKLKPQSPLPTELSQWSVFPHLKFCPEFEMH